MKPAVISNANTSAPTGSGNLQTSGNGVTIPINQEYREQSTNQNYQHPQAHHFVANEPQMTSYGSPGALGRGQRQQQQHSEHHQEPPTHFQDFDFEPDVGLDMFPRTRLGRMTHDPFGDFGGTSRKRTSLHDPQFHTDGFSRYFDGAADFGFPQFNSLGRRRINPHNDDDFFNRLPSEFRQYIPESFAHRHTGMASPGSGPTTVEPQQSTHQSQSHLHNTMPQSSPRKVCDAAIQTEDPTGRSEVDHVVNSEKLSQHGLRNTMDMGVKSPSEKENQSPRSSSAPPTEHQKNLHQAYTHPQKISENVPNRSTTPQLNQYATQTSPQTQCEGYGGQSPRLKKMVYTPQQTHSEQKHQTPSPQTPGGSYIRTIPIFVEGRTEPIINNKEIPNQNAQANVASTSDNTRSFTPPKQQPRRLTPLNTQQCTASSATLPPQTPHTIDTINKIQDIQRDVLALMSRVEKFTGTRVDKEYVYLDEMLTRNLLKLDNIETNGKDSIRLARREAIKCIQASINVLEAKAEENKKSNQKNMEPGEETIEETFVQKSISAAEIQKSTPSEKNTKELKQTIPSELVMESVDNSRSEPIPLPPPETEKFNEVIIEDCPEDDVHIISANEKCILKVEDTSKNLSK